MFGIKLFGVKILGNVIRSTFRQAARENARMGTLEGIADVLEEMIGERPELPQTVDVAALVDESKVSERTARKAKRTARTNGKAKANGAAKRTNGRARKPASVK